METSDAGGKARIQGLTLITGAASGIGRELARTFTRNTHDVVLVDIDEPGLSAVAEELESEPGTVQERIAVDLTDDCAIDTIENEIKPLTQPVEILVNNAGIPLYGPVIQTKFENKRRLLRLNIEVVTALIDLFAPRMVARGSGKILNVSSLAGLVPVPTAAVYGASKAYVHSFSQALADELDGTGVTVTTLYPGETATSFMDRGNMERSALSRDSAMSAQSVASKAYDGLMAGSRVVVPGFRNRARYYLSMLLPSWVSARVARRLWSGTQS